MNIRRKGDRVFLSGVINENSDFSSLVSETSPLRIDFSGVERINSIGVRNWMLFLTKWDDQKAIEYHQCSAPIVDQLGVIVSLKGVRKKVAEVKSIRILAECGTCNQEATVPITADDYRKNKDLQTYLKPCKDCGNPTFATIHNLSDVFA